MSSIAELDSSWLSGMEEVLACQQNQNYEALAGIDSDLDNSKVGNATSFSALPEVANFTQAIINMKDANEDGKLTMDEVNNDKLFAQIDTNADEEITEDELCRSIDFEVQQFSDVLELLQPNADLKGTSQLSDLMGNSAKPTPAMFKQLMQQAS